MTIRRSRIRWTRVVGVLVLVAAIVVAVGSRLSASLPSVTALPSTAVSTLDAFHGGNGEADGHVPDGTTVFDDDVPAVAKLDRALLDAVRQAATDAADDGITVLVNSGWRTPKYQARLLREAVSTYGSEAEAARWVATAKSSPHVSGDAIDVGPYDAQAWLSEHGAAYGLCRIYDNEPWHYELRRGAVRNGCPPTYADPTADPRMH
ncbi:MAG: M15 family metallopeptidase [Patulibacter sp.]